LIYRGTVDASAVAGKAGTLLLDPKNIIIANTGSDPAGSDVNEFSDDSAGDVTIDPSDIATLLNEGTSVTLQANNDITVSDPLTADATDHSDTTLSLQAGRTITINALMQLFGIDAEFSANDPSAQSEIGIRAMQHLIISVSFKQNL